ncbi:MAG: alpha/beta hydrolase, partial [Pseudonocardia sp.]|nr:alpha/beta hydrolase [Pseudonocardia sp.]
MTTWHLSRPGGRRVAVHELTPDAPAGAPIVLLCHPAPGSGAFDPDPEVTAGVRLIAPDRPGYGGSDPVPGLATVDLAARGQHPVEHGRGVAGWSAGGRVALALAAQRPELVGRVAVIGTPAPDEQVPWYGENRAMIDPMRGLPEDRARAALDEAFGPMLQHLTGDDRFALVTDPEVDAALLARPAVAERLRAMLDTAFAAGAAGMAAEVGGYTLAPWGFDPADVRAEVLLGYGAADAPVGVEHGRWWEQALPSAQL